MVSDCFWENRQIGIDNILFVQNFECWNATAAKEWCQDHLYDQNCSSSPIVRVQLHATSAGRSVSNYRADKFDNNDYYDYDDCAVNASSNIAGPFGGNRHW